MSNDNAASLHETFQLHSDIARSEVPAIHENSRKMLIFREQCPNLLEV